MQDFISIVVKGCKGLIAGFVAVAVNKRKMRGKKKKFMHNQ